MSIELVTTFTGAAVATVLAAVITRSMRPILLEQKDRREKSRAKLKEQLLKKYRVGLSWKRRRS